MFFEGELPKPLYLSEYRIIRENIEIAWPTKARIETQWKAEDATLVSEEEKGDPVPVFWASATYPAGKTGCVWVEIRPGEKRYNTLAFPSIWLGYERVTFVCDNPGAAPVKLEFVIEDFEARACRDTKYRGGQAAVVSLTAPPGKHALSASLKDLKTIDGRRWLDLSNVYRIGFRVPNPLAEQKLRFTDIRIRTTDENAGILVPREGGRRCVRCEQRLDDANCIACPFCGKFYNENAVVTKPAPASAVFFPVKDGHVMASSGGGGATVDGSWGTRPGMSVCHYDVSFWEGRAFLRFDPSTLPAGRRIRKAELRLRRRKPGQGKSWLCPLRIFVAPDGKDDFDEKTLSWITQPPLGSFAAQGGLYYYWTDALALDVTQFMWARMAKTRKPFTLILRAFEAEPCKENAHLFGHHLPIDSREARDESRRPQLYVELE